MKLFEKIFSMFFSVIQISVNWLLGHSVYAINFFCSICLHVQLYEKLRMVPTPGTATKHKLIQTKLCLNSWLYILLYIYFTDILKRLAHKTVTSFFEIAWLFMNIAYTVVQADRNSWPRSFFQWRNLCRARISKSVSSRCITTKTCFFHKMVVKSNYDLHFWMTALKFFNNNIFPLLTISLFAMHNKILICLPLVPLQHT
jgi:hypothetical protein